MRLNDQQPSAVYHMIMKHFAILLLLVGFALPERASANDEARAAAREARMNARMSRSMARPRPPAMQPMRQGGPMRMQRSLEGMRGQQRSFGGRNAVRSERSLEGGDFGAQRQRARVYNAPRVSPQPVINTAAVTDQATQPSAIVNPPMGRRDGNRADRMREWAARNREWRGRDVTPTNPGSQDIDGTTGSVTTPDGDAHAGHRHGDDRHRDRRSWRERHREWHERHQGDPNFDEKHRRYHRRHYNREWWRRNYNRFVLFGGGYYYWNHGYWYPAYGYDPYYSTYTYDAPLYGYNGLPPGQVISLVQSQLQQRGYYRAAVDGSFGPMTRQALLNYQGDAGLPMTGEIDEETLQSLGLN
jgi:hypothetical protein